MNPKTKAWISAARPRTLPLSISGILVGSAYAYGYLAYAKAEKITSTTQTSDEFVGLQGLVDLFNDYVPTFNWWIPALALLTTLGFQILSNFANDYGDGIKGTDNDDRIGPMRAIQSGIITPAEMKKVIIATAVLTFISAVGLIILSLGIQKLLVSILFLALGIAAIWAAIKYTVGNDAYGYRGLGDVFVFIFFGPVSVLGVSYLITQSLESLLIFPSMTIGLLSVAVLNLNNMRDIQSDSAVGKNTIAVKLGINISKKLHYTFILMALLFMMLFLTILSVKWPTQGFNTLILFLPLIAFLPLIKHMATVKKIEKPVFLDPELKKVALSTFLLSLLSILSMILVLNF